MQKVMSGNCMPTLEKLLAISNFFDVPLTVLITPNSDVSQEVQIASDKLKKLSPDAVHLAHAQINYMYIAESNPYTKK
jgi:transcriptional regulator with XRE-family HTH domain